MIADIAGGLSTITGGFVLAAQGNDRALEYLTQTVELVQDGQPLTREQIHQHQLLIAIRTEGSLARFGS